ncbi:hypothetical protein [Shewanella gaetbuli]
MNKGISKQKQPHLSVVKAVLLGLYLISACLNANAGVNSRHYFTIQGEVFFGHFTAQQGLRVYNYSYSPQDDIVKNKLGKHFMTQKYYDGINQDNIVMPFGVEQVNTLASYECTPECGATVELAKNAQPPLLMWTGKLDVKLNAAIQCYVNEQQNEAITKQIDAAVTDFFKPYFPKTLANYAYKIVEQTCHSFKTNEGEVSEITVAINVHHQPHQDIYQDLQSFTPVFIFKIINNQLFAVNTVLSTECCGFHTGENSFINSIVSINDYEVVVYKWVGLENQGYSMEPLATYFNTNTKK